MKEKGQLEREREKASGIIYVEYFPMDEEKTGAQWTNDVRPSRLGAIAQRGATRVVRHRSQPTPTPRDERSERSRNGGS